MPLCMDQVSPMSSELQAAGKVNEEEAALHYPVTAGISMLHGQSPLIVPGPIVPASYGPLNLFVAEAIDHPQHKLVTVRVVVVLLVAQHKTLPLQEIPMAALHIPCRPRVARSYISPSRKGAHAT